MFGLIQKNDERIGEMYALSSALLFAGFPIIIHYAAGKIPAIFYAATSTLASAILMGVILFLRKEWKQLKNKKAWFPLFMVTVTIVVIPSVLMYKGAGYTSGINTGILMMAEIFFTLLMTTLWLKEKLTVARFLGALGIVLGTLLILYNGAFSFNKGDWMIIAATVFYPIGNVYAKRALALVSPAGILFVRSLLGGMALLALSVWFERADLTGGNYREFLLRFWPIILLNGILLYGASKLIWYEGLKRLDIGKAIIIAMSYPAFSMILATVFLKEIPTPYQFSGLVIILFGLYSVSYNRSKLPPHAV